MIRNRDVVAAATAAAVVAGLAAVGCSKQPRETTAAQVEPLAAEGPMPPPLFEAIPADTPYLFASLDPFPDKVWEALAKALGRMHAAAAPLAGAALAAEKTPAELRLLLAAIDEIGQNPSREGLEALGLHPNPHVAVYGLGALPVARLQIGDAEALRRAIGRIESRSGFELPTRQVAGQDLWWFGESEAENVAVAILGDELVATFGPAAAVTSAFEVLVGERELGVAALTESEIRARAEAEGLSALGFGYVDSQQLARLLLGGGDGAGADITASLVGADLEVSDACVTAVDGALAHAPGVVLGYTELSSERAVMEGRITLSEELAKLALAAQTRMPGLTGSFEEPPLFAIGAAADLKAGARVLARVAAELQTVGEACEDAEIQASAAELAAAARGAIPPPFSSIRGGMLVLHSLEPAMMRGEGYALVGVNRPGALLRLARPFVPQLARVDIATDGQFRALPAGLTEMVPFDLGLSYAIGTRGVAIAAGDIGRGLAEAAMANNSDASPLLLVAYDYGAFMDLLMGVMPQHGEPEEQVMRAVVEAMGSYFGFASTVLAPDERGLRIQSELELRSPGGE